MEMNLKNLLLMSLVVVTTIFCAYRNKKEVTPKAPKMKYILDMVFNNPGEMPTNSEYNDPVFLKSRGYNGMVGEWFCKLCNYL